MDVKSKKIKVKCIGTGNIGIQPVVGKEYTVVQEKGESAIHVIGFFVIKAPISGQTIELDRYKKIKNLWGTIKGTDNINIVYYSTQEFTAHFGKSAMAALKVLQWK